MSVEIKGLNELTSNLNKLSSGVSNIPKHQSVSVSELLNDNFMQKNTRFKSLSEMEDVFKKQTGKEADKDALETEEWSRFISQNTDFKSWNELIRTAGRDHVGKQVSNVFKNL